MEYLVEGKQINQFQEEGMILLEGFFSTQQLIGLKSSIYRAYSKKLKITISDVYELEEEKRFLAARDLWRFDEELKKFVCSRKVASIGAMLCGEKCLRVAFSEHRSFIAFKENQVLSDCFSFDQLHLVLCVDLDKGTFIFIDPNKPLKSSLESKEEFLLIGYGGKDLIYVYEDQDPFVHELKKLGYVFGDRLKDQTNPIVYRGV